MTTDTVPYPIRYDIPVPNRKPIDRATRMGPKPTKLRLTLEQMGPGGSSDIPLADFPGILTIPGLLCHVSSRAVALGSGKFTAQGHEDFVRIWRKS